MGDAQVGDLARRGVLDVVATDRRLAGVERAQAGDRLDQLGLPVALHARDDHDLARADLEVDAVDRELEAVVANLRTAQAEYDLAGLRRTLADDQLHVAADHHVGQLLAGRDLGVRRAGDASAAQDDDVVGDLEHLVELVRDEDDRRAGRRERPDDPEQLLRLERREHGADGSSRTRMSLWR